MLKHVIFDLDGTLIDTVDLHALSWVETFAHFGVSTPFFDVRNQIGKGGDQLMPVFLDQRVIDKCGPDIEAFRVRLFSDKYFPSAQPFPNVRELFTAIRRAQAGCAIASSCSADELPKYLKLANINDLVEAATTADDVKKSKPHPDVFHAILDKLPKAANKDETIVIGDSPYDAVAAGKAGLRTIGVLSGGFSENDLRKAGCMELYADPSDLLVNFDRWFALQ